jgi:lipoprotein-anchoring transpeptidase ErfK/SrfK
MSLDLNEPNKTQAKPQQPVSPEPKIETEVKPEQLQITTTLTPQETPQTPVVPLDPTAAADAQAQAVIDEAMSIINARPMEIIKARDMLNELLGKPISSAKRRVIKQELSKLADRWLFSQTVYPKDPLCSLYNVQSGDLLSTIGSKYKVPWEILLQINQIPSPQSLQAGQTIKVINGPFHAKVFRSTFIMDLYLQDTFVRSFPVGLGKTDYETPTGLWVVRPGGKLIKPRWTDPDTGKTYEADDPDYPLGSRWISLDGLEGAAVGRTGFAIHGTKDPHEIGSAKSRGCIRLFNGDVILVYDLLMPGESKVLVTN